MSDGNDWLSDVLIAVWIIVSIGVCVFAARGFTEWLMERWLTKPHRQFGRKDEDEKEAREMARFWSGCLAFVTWLILSGVMIELGYRYYD